MIRAYKGKVAALLALSAVFVMAFAQAAFATGVEPEYSKLTTGVTDELGTIVTPLLIALGAVLAVSWGVRFLYRRLHAAN
jgi:hypothetical protein